MRSDELTRLSRLPTALVGICYTLVDIGSLTAARCLDASENDLLRRSLPSLEYTLLLTTLAALLGVLGALIVRG